MARLCARPGCTTPAAATFTFDGLQRIVWLNSLADAPANGAGDLCWHHAERLRPPRNWELRDTRSAPPPAASGPPANGPTRAPATTTGPRAAETAAGRRRRAPTSLGPADRARVPSVDAPATTPLLARAFRGVGRG